MKPKPWAEMSQAERQAAWALVEMMVAVAMQDLSDELSQELNRRGVPFQMKIAIEFEPLEGAR